IDKILEYIDIIKVDFLESTDVEIKEIADKYKSEKILLAEKIERKEVFDFAKKLGYNFFQGYFFGKPEILKSLL
ncbi:MAG: EAL and HDOD domain-containing protein, partial [Sarcina sp.]